MILKTKPYTVGCGIILNPNASSDRCGQPKSSRSFGGRGLTQLCGNCQVKQTANTLMALLESKGETA
jgi:hypothetical protein